MTDALSRRRFLQATGAALTAGTAFTAGAAAPALGTLAAWPAAGASTLFERPWARVGLLQTRALAVERTRPQHDLQRNLQHMLSQIDRAQAAGPQHDWLAFHQCPLTGWQRWSPAEAARIAIDPQGPQIAALAAKAREYGCHLSFGALLRLADWPGHVIDATVFLSRRGEIESLQWAPLASPACGQVATTTIADVLDAYVERYGRAELVRIARTDIGDLCAAPTADDPTLHAVLARAGAQFVLRTHAGALPAWSRTGADCCRRDGIHGGLVNAAVATDLRQFVDSPTGGGSTLYGPDGDALAGAPDGDERIVSTVLRIGASRVPKRNLAE